jgi:hypothetical protein
VVLISAVEKAEPSSTLIHAVLTDLSALSRPGSQKSKGSALVRDHSLRRSSNHGPSFSIVTGRERRRTACGCPVVTYRKSAFYQWLTDVRHDGSRIDGAAF